MNIAILLAVGSQVLVSHNVNKTGFYPASAVKLFVAEHYFRKGHENHARDLRRLIVHSSNPEYSKLIRHAGVSKINARLAKHGFGATRLTRCLCRGNRTSASDLQRFLRSSFYIPGLRPLLNKAMRRRQKLVRRFFPRAEVYGKSGSVAGMSWIENFIIERPGGPNIALTAVVKWSYAGCGRSYSCMRKYMDGMLTGLLMSIPQKGR